MGQKDKDKEERAAADKKRTNGEIQGHGIAGNPILLPQSIAEPSTPVRQDMEERGERKGGRKVGKKAGREREWDGRTEDGKRERRKENGERDGKEEKRTNRIEETAVVTLLPPPLSLTTTAG